MFDKLKVIICVQCKNVPKNTNKKLCSIKFPINGILNFFNSNNGEKAIVLFIKKRNIKKLIEWGGQYLSQTVLWPI